MKKKSIFLFGLLILITLSCNQKTVKLNNSNTDRIVNIDYSAPDWSKNATIYEVNIRQYTPQGTFNAFIPYLKTLKKLGADILWIMPPYPIGKERRKGKLGSPYSISNYTAINPDMGSEKDFKRLVTKAHSLGLKIILDWVGNHSSFDNKWAIEHPEWYTKDSLGNITHPKGTDWTDVADFNYDNKEMRSAMIDAMKYWVSNYNIDGYRCDVAGFVPNDFWHDAITELQKIKHVFMLAEWEDPLLHKAGFHMTYGWELHHIMNQIAKGKMIPLDLDTFFEKDFGRFPKDAYRMNFTTNHDENSWNGTIKERMGDAANAMTVLAFTIQGMPLVYSGQEAGLNKRLSFFGKDTIDWSLRFKSHFHKNLLALHHRNKALWNGSYGSKFKKIITTNDKIYAYKRIKGNDEVLVFLNLSKKNQFFKVTQKLNTKIKYKNIITGESNLLSNWIHNKNQMKPWDYLVLERLK